MSPVSRTKQTAYVFRAVPLRNVALTPPSFHSGKVWDLGQAVGIMGVSQLGRQLNNQEIADIVAFLGSLTGEFPRIELPRLPPRTEKTPRPLVMDPSQMQGSVQLSEPAPPATP